MKFTASFPMYNFPEMRGALDIIWKSLARQLEREGVDDVPSGLAHGRALHTLWTDPTLLVSQCCGYDVVKRYAGKLVPLATPRYDAPGCKKGNYSSVIVVSEDSQFTNLDQLRDRICVINGPESHSGANALRAMIGPLSRHQPFFSRVEISGSHAESIATLIRGEADVTCIDCVTYALLKRYRPSLPAGTRELCYTASAPGVPYVTRAAIGAELTTKLQRSLVKIFEKPEVQAAGQAVFIDGIEVFPLSRYNPIAELERYAAAQGYPELG